MKPDRREMARFRRERPEWDDLPDEHVAKSMAYAWWVFGVRLARVLPRWLRRLYGLPGPVEGGGE